MNFATTRVIGYYDQSTLGISLAVLVSLFSLLVVLSSWGRGFNSPSLAPVIVALFVLGLATVTSLGAWPIALFFVVGGVLLSVMR